MVCMLFNFCPQSAQSRRNGDLVGLAPETKFQAPKLKHEILNQWSFVNF